MSGLAPGSSLILAGCSFAPVDHALPPRVVDTWSSVVGGSVDLLGAASTVVAAEAQAPDWEKPVWDGVSRELSFRGQLVKALRRDAENQQTVLNALQKAGWPPWIANPLPPDEGVDVRDRIYNTVKRLNLQHCPLLGFFADGDGAGICWSAFE